MPQLYAIYKYNLTKIWFEIEELMSTQRYPNKNAALSQGEPRDVAINFDTYRILQ